MKKIISIILAVSLLICSNSLVGFADESNVANVGAGLGASSVIDTLIIIPTIEQVQSQTEFDRLINGGQLGELSANELLLTIAQAAYELDSRGASSEGLEIFVPTTYSTLLPRMTNLDFVQIITTKAYPESFRLYFMDFYNMFSEQNSQEFENALIDIVTDTAESDILRSYAVMDVNFTPQNKINIKNLYDEVVEDVKPSILKSMFHAYPDEAKEIARSIMKNFDSENRQLVIMANKVYALTLENDETEKSDFFSLCRAILRGDDEELAEQCLYALAGIKSPEAVSLVFEAADFNNFGIKRFIDKNFKLVTSYLDTASFEDLKKCVMAVPISEFVPYLEEKQNHYRVVDTNGQSLMQMYNAIEEYNSPEKAETRDVATGFQGFAAYRDGVDILFNYEAWHGAIVNSDDAQDPQNSQDEKPYIQATGTNDYIRKVVDSEFLGGNNSFRGFRKFNGMTQRERNDVLTTARELTAYRVAYSFPQLMIADTSTLADFDMIEPHHIKKMRCDGLIEYCFEYAGLKLQNSSSVAKAWDISTKFGLMNGHSGVVLTPYTQYHAPFMTW